VGQDGEQGPGEGRTCDPQFLADEQREAAQQVFAVSGEVDVDFAAVAGALAANDRAQRFKAVDEFDGAVGPEAESLG